MPSKPFSIRADIDKQSRWKDVAQKQGMSRNRWAVRALDEKADEDEAAMQENAEAIAQREAMKSVAFPDQGAKCKHVQKGFFCYQCGTTRWA